MTTDLSQWGKCLFSNVLQAFKAIFLIMFREAMHETKENCEILQCADVSQAAEHSYSQMCDLIVTKVKTLHETETRKHPILKTTQMVKGQIPGNSFSAQLNNFHTTTFEVKGKA